MTDPTDWQLIRKYVEGDRQAAFSALVRRHTDLVYCTCLRELGEPSLAEDAAQAVFLILARKAASFRPGTTLSSWLFQTALLTSKNVLRRERRQQAREQRMVAEMERTMPPRPSGWEEMEPRLNEALEGLPTAQRGLVLERFLEDRPLAEIGAARGISEDAARMRLNRALDRLRRFFAARNVVLPAAALAALLPLAVRPAPARCAEALLRLALPPAASDSPIHAIAQGAIHTMTLKRLRLQLGAAALVAVLSISATSAVRVHTQVNARAAIAEKAAAKRQDQTRALAVLDRMYATYAAMHSFRCEVTSREVTTDTNQEGAYEIQRPNKVRFHRASLLGPDGTGRAAAVSDGSNLYVTCTEGNGLADRYAKMPLAKPFVRQDYSADMLFSNFGGLNLYGTEPEAGMPDAALGVKWSDWVNPQQSAPEYAMGQPILMDERINGWVVKGAKVDVVSYQRYWITSPSAPPEKPLRVTYYIGQSDHLLYKMTVAAVVDATHSELIRTENIDDFDINPKLPTSDFVFTPAPGSHEVRSTGALFPNLVPNGRM